jgi:Major Facilitator Superfamily
MESKPVRRLLMTQAVTSVGDGIFFVVSATLLLAQGWSAARVGLALSLAWGVSMLLTPAVGRAADAVGLRTTVLALPVLVATGLLLVAAGGPDALTLVGLMTYAGGQSGLGGVRQALVVALAAGTGRSVTEDRSALQAAGNGGIAVGSVFGGVALALDGHDALRAALLLDAALFLGSVALYTGLPRLALPSSEGRSGPRPDARYLALTLCAAVMYLYMPLLSVGLPLMVVRAELAHWVVALVLALNTLGVLALQRRAGRAVSSAALAARYTVRGGVMLLVCCLFLGLSVTVVDWPLGLAVLLTGVVVQVLGEVRLAAGAWHLGYELAPPVASGRWQGTYAAAVPAARCVGPALLTGLLVGLGLAGFVVLGLMFAAAGVGMAVLSRGAAEPSPTPHRWPAAAR